jgi:uncharacterized damage-inducible protein DinB
MTKRDRHIVIPVQAAVPEIGRALWALEDARKRTWRVLEGLNEAIVDWIPSDGGHTVGTLLYHIAAIELDWLYVEVLESQWDAETARLFPYAVREADGRLTRVVGMTLAEHRARLDVVRGLLLAGFAMMSLDEFQRTRSLELYDVTPEWVVHHLCQHEAEHRGELGLLRSRAEAALNAGK